LPIPQGCPPVLSSLMQLCWQTDPKARPTFKQILTQLDQIDLDENVKYEINELFNTNKPKWELEIEQAFEKLKKVITYFPNFPRFTIYRKRKFSFFSLRSKMI
jgi:hypothetical protein